MEKRALAIPAIIERKQVHVQLVKASEFRHGISKRAGLQTMQIKYGRVAVPCPMCGRNEPAVQLRLTGLGRIEGDVFQRQSYGGRYCLFCVQGMKQELPLPLPEEQHHR